MAETELLATHKVDWAPKEPESNWLLSSLGLLLPFVLIIGFLVWMNKRAQGQMGNVMSIGRSRAKAYQADKPSTTFADIAGLIRRSSSSASGCSSPWRGSTSSR